MHFTFYILKMLSFVLCSFISFLHSIFHLFVYCLYVSVTFICLFPLIPFLVCACYLMCSIIIFLKLFVYCVIILVFCDAFHHYLLLFYSSFLSSWLYSSFDYHFYNLIRTFLKTHPFFGIVSYSFLFYLCFCVFFIIFLTSLFCIPFHIFIYLISLHFYVYFHFIPFLYMFYYLIMFVFVFICIILLFCFKLFVASIVLLYNPFSILCIYLYIYLICCVVRVSFCVIMIVKTLCLNFISCISYIVLN